MAQRFTTVFQVFLRYAMAVAMMASFAAAGAMNPVDSLRRELVKQQTAADSLPVMLNLYDVIHFS